jgi:hypothetical protein
MRTFLFCALLAIHAPAALAAGVSLQERCGVSSTGSSLASAFGGAKSTTVLPLLGDPNTAGELGLQVVAAIRDEFGVDASCLRVVILPKDELQKRGKTLGGGRYFAAPAGFTRAPWASTRPSSSTTTR